MRLIFPLLACIPLAGCLGLFGPDCINETRGLSSSARLTSIVSATDTGRAYLGLDEARNHRSKATASRDFLWFVSSTLVRSRVTAVHVHEQGTNRLLLTIPLDSIGPPFVITQTFTRQPYNGSVDWNELYNLVGTERTYVDVHTFDNPAGELRGVLKPEYPNWENFFHGYCS